MSLGFCVALQLSTELVMQRFVYLPESIATIKTLSLRVYEYWRWSSEENHDGNIPP